MESVTYEPVVAQDLTSTLSSLKTAFVHDNYLQRGGAERVAETIAKALPWADLFSSAVLPEKISPYLRSRHIHDTFMRFLPGLREKYRLYFPLFPLAIRSLKLSDYDLVVTSCCGFGKMIRKRKDAIHICYCHTPTRWIWRFEDYVEREGFSPLTRAILRKVVRAMRRMDLKSAQSPNFFLANSNNVAERIRRFYGRFSVVLHPPIECSRFSVSYYAEDYYVILSRLVSYKRIDLAIAACEKVKRKLMIIGDGPDRERLEVLGGEFTTFRGQLSDREVSVALQNCRGLIFPGDEDFGMSPLEANATGKPCIAFGIGGARETVIDGETGVLFMSPTVDSLTEALIRSESVKWNPERLRAHAERFDTAVFTERLLALLLQMVGEGRSTNIKNSRATNLK